MAIELRGHELMDSSPVIYNPCFGVVMINRVVGLVCCWRRLLMICFYEHVINGLIMITSFEATVMIEVDRK
jgi:hypothetical protein